MGVLRFIIQMALSIALPLLVQWMDKKRLRPEQRDRAWNVATWGCALYAFGPLSMLGWGWVTRKSVGGLFGGFGVMVALVLVIDAVDVGVGRIAGGDDQLLLVEAFSDEPPKRPRTKVKARERVAPPSPTPTTRGTAPRVVPRTPPRDEGRPPAKTR